jgi:hypothetical protein
MTSLELELATTALLASGIAVAMDAPSSSKLRMSALENTM